MTIGKQLYRGFGVILVMLATLLVVDLAALWKAKSASNEAAATLESVRALGGHPLLVQACVECVKEWKYETAPEESTQIVEFDFKQS